MTKDWNEDLLTEHTVWERKEIIRDNKGNIVTKEQMEEDAEYTYGEVEF